MKSKSILAIHTFSFFFLVGASLSSPFLMAYYPQVFTGKAVVIGFTILALLVLGSWPLYGGECPFTVWENNFRKREGKKAYREACIDRYAARGFGIKLPKYFSTYLSVALLILPIAVGLAHW